MSRLSRKSELSPSITKPSNSIDLGKNSGIDMGRKSQPSLTSGGIGITQEVTNVGGMSVSVGGNVDITPLDFGININPSEGTVSIATGAEIPGGILGVSGGIEIDLNTGEVIGGSIGGEALGLGINVSNSKKGGIAIEFSVQIPGTPIELSLGFGFPPKEPKTLKSPKDPTTKPDTNNLPPKQPDVKYTPPEINIKDVEGCTLSIKYSVTWTRVDPYAGTCASFLRGFNLANIGKPYYSASADGISASTTTLDDVKCSSESWQYQTLWAMQTISQTTKYSYDIHWKIPNRSSQDYLNSVLNYVYAYIIPHEYTYWETDGEIVVIGGGRPIVEWRRVTEPSISVFDCQQQQKNREIYNPTNKNPPPPLPFPNPPPRRRNKMDACCRENLAFLRAIYTRLGLAKFPGKLPSTIIQQIPEEGEQPAEPPQEPIADFVDLFMWQFRRDDERWGQWEIEINIKDANLTKEGNQSKSVRFPNLAESVAEIEGQMLSLQANVEALVALSIRNLSESGMARQEAIKGYLASMAIAKYMAFPYKEFDVEIPSTYTPGATSIDKLIVESIIHTKGIDYEDKETQRDLLLDLLQAAAITRAVHWRQVNPKNDIKKQILSQLKGSVDLSEKITNVKAVATDGDTSPKKESWEDKLDAIENGFGFSTGIEDANTPYGRDRERRPRIRQIGDNIAQAGKDE